MARGLSPAPVSGCRAPNSSGRTGSALARRLAERGVTTRTAARDGADVRFDWDDPATHHEALAGVDRLYLVTPVPRVAYTDQVAAVIAAVSGDPVAYHDLDQDAWTAGAIAAGLPAEYAVMLRWLTDTIISGDGSVPTGDVEQVTGRRPATFREFAERNADVWRVRSR